MPHASFNLADVGLGNILVFGIVAAIWLIGQAMAAANKLSKNTGKRPPTMGSPPRPAGAGRRSLFADIGRPGGPATGLDEARRMAQARMAQAKAALRQAGFQRAELLPQQRPAPVAPPPPRAAVPPPPAPPPPPIPARPVVVAKKAVPIAARPASAPRTGLRPTLTPQSLRSQFILTEILRPPVSMRDGEGR